MRVYYFHGTKVSRRIGTFSPGFLGNLVLTASRRYGAVVQWFAGRELPLFLEVLSAMSVLMAERIRMIIDTDEEIRLAVKLAANKAGLSVSEFVNRVLREKLVNELRDAKKYLPQRGKEE